MIGTRVTAGLLLAAGLLVPAAAASAGDIHRLDLRTTADPAADRPAGEDEQDDLYSVGFRGGFGGGFRGGYRGGFGGGFRGGFVGGFRGYYGGFRSFYGGYRGFYSGFRPFYGFGFGYPAYYGFSYPAFYGSSFPTYVYPQASIFTDPCAAPALTLSTPVVSLRIGALPFRGRVLQSVSPATILPGPLPGTGPTLPPPVMGPAAGAPDGTFPYDGGPRDPVPMPKLEDSPVGFPGGPVAPDLRVVSIRSSLAESATATGKWSYPAYGEQPRRASADRPAR